MGRHKNKRVLKRDFKEPRKDQWEEHKTHKNTANFEPHELTNEAFEEYYQAQQIVPEGEWDNFMAALRSSLPTTFRINGSGRFAADLRDRLGRDFLSQFSGGEPIYVSGERLDPPQTLPWYPDRLAWQFSFSRNQLRKLPILEAVHELMKRENAAGSITRQEAVSMIPPLFLDVQPHHRVLDTCAAPGSKTAQVLEMLHQGVQLPSGCVVANDIDAQRCNLLTHQVKRMCSPALVVTNHDASLFPLVAPKGTRKGQESRYDRVLCDVLCSGDGTLRKSPDIWRRWTAGNGNALHILQLRIALRACQLVKVGGRLVYSTCTFNPVEDEAVVAEVLRQSHGAMELLDVSAELPGLKRMPGKQSWLVRDRQEFRSVYSEEAVGKVLRSMYPPVPSEGSLPVPPLERCMRVLPHHNDSGGFFIAVLRKVADIPTTLPTRPLSPASLSTAAVPQPREGQQGQPQQQQQHQQPAAAHEAAADAGTACIAALPDAALALQSAPQPAPAPASGDAPPASDMLQASPSRPDTCDTDTPTAPPPATAAEHAEPAADAPANGPAPVRAAGQPSTSGAALAPQWGTRGGGARGRDGGGGKWRGIDPVIPFTDAASLQSISDFFGFPPGTPIGHQLVSRSGADVALPKRLYYVSSGVKTLLLEDEYEQLKVTATGLKVFERQETKDGRTTCPYRISQEGLPVLLPYVTKQLLQPSLEEFLALLTHRSMALPPHLHPAFVDGGTEQQNGHGPGAAANTYDASEKPPALASAANGVGTDTAAIDGEAEQDQGPEEAEGLQPELAVKIADDQEPEAKKRKVIDGVLPSTVRSRTYNAHPRVQGGGAEPKATLNDPETLQQLLHISSGCCVLTLRPGEEKRLGVRGALSLENAAGGPPPLAIVCWRGRNSINILVSKAECQQMLDTLKGAADAARQNE